MDNLFDGELFARKLSQFTRLGPTDRQALTMLSGDRVRRVRARDDLIRENERPTGVKLMLSGWASRYKIIEDGRRQIMAFLVPGDICDLNVFILRDMDHSVGALTTVTFADIARETIEFVMDEFPRVAQALLWDQLVAHSIQREWTINLGRRSAFERIAHLLCELFLRLRGVGLADGQSCGMPLTQADLADATGLSAVHVNRTLQELRSQNLIVLRGRELVVPDFEALQQVAGFNRNYLHLDREGRHLDANDV